MSVKILELKNNDWLKGISASTNIPMGGLFQTLNGVNPFEQGGVALPSLTPANKTLPYTPRTLEGFQNAGVPYVYAHCDTKLYQVMVNSPYTVTDVTSQVFQHFTFGTILNHLGRVTWKNRYVYASKTTTGNSYISANALPVASGSDVLIKDGLGADWDYVSLCVGADNNCYYNYGQGQIGVLTSVTGTTGNNTTHLIDDQFFVRSFINDGNFLVIFADNNAPNIANRSVGAFKCRIYFWDMVTTDGNNYITPDAMWEFNDSYIIGAQSYATGIANLSTGLLVFTQKDIYVTNVATYPKPIRPFPNTPSNKMGVPLNSFQITVDPGSVYWVDGTYNFFPYIHAYGNPLGGTKIFYNPYTQNTGNNYLATCLTVSGNQLILGCDQPGLFIFNVGTTRGNALITTIDQTLEQPYRYDYTKVTLSQPLTVGQSVQCVASTQNGVTISNETKSYNAAKPKQTFLFRRVPGTGAPDRVEDLTITINTVGAGVARITAYGTPLDDGNEDI